MAKISRDGSPPSRSATIRCRRNAKLAAAFGLTLPAWDGALRLCLDGDPAMAHGGCAPARR
ncbi:MAG: hypothetical protein A3F73_11240 [Gallionellales bacterium RIFCSPLOWO2_12_FULL_59_22]|nr:MAG: hypothetical protein A3H99_10915 [Gallionellales bacterium RIFCSPLOWO2_02_FULL_59_110]OGT04666.1 MAG: hypothetical protein A2Z65_05130 [Gallionellales bacterium RIFCSPLOWO2_02_58_13]OGT11853.1 MAG: hypothetical protein A3F73_11240 [Gallionellales bacterium RIFCSPLOWO2_12_FULL_59_22]